MIQMIETMKGIFLSENGDVSIAISAFVDMDHLPNFDEMVAHPVLLIPQKISVDALLSKSCGGRTRQVQCDAICHGTQHSIS
jgi:hypothetical protein